MGVFGAFFGRRGDGGFSSPLLGVCRGDAGFNVAMLSRLVRDIRRPARPDVGASAKKFAQRHCSHRVSAKKFAQHTKNGPKWVFEGALGELLRGNAAGGAELGEFFADQHSRDPAERVCCAEVLPDAPVYWQC